jgi:hypothetical protein
MHGNILFFHHAQSDLGEFNFAQDVAAEGVAMHSAKKRTGIQA